MEVIHSPIFHRSRLKLSRALEHIADIQGKFDAYKARMPVYILVRQHTSMPDHVHVRTFYSEPLPQMISTIIGDAIHNLRSSLDLLACDLVSRVGGDLKHVQFPYAKSETKLSHEIKNRNIDNILNDALHKIKHFKPYYGGNKYYQLVHELDIIDKHINIILILGGFKFPGFSFNLELFGLPHTMDSIMEKRIFESHEIGLGKIFHPDYELMFYNEPFHGRPVITMLKDCFAEFLKLVEEIEDIYLDAFLKNNSEGPSPTLEELKDRALNAFKSP